MIKLVKIPPNLYQIHQKCFQSMAEKIENMHIKTTINSIWEILCFEQEQRQGRFPKLCIDLYSLVQYYQQVYAQLQKAQEKQDQNNEKKKSNWQKIILQAFHIFNIIINLGTFFGIKEMVLLTPGQRISESDKNYPLIHDLLHKGIDFQSTDEGKSKEEKYALFEQVFKLINNEYFHDFKINIVYSPWIDRDILRENPCIAQQAYYASKGYLCLSWNPNCLLLIPKSSYIIGFNIFKLVRIHLTQELQQYFINFKYSMYINNEDSQVNKKYKNKFEYNPEEKCLTEKQKLLLNSYEYDLDNMIEVKQWNKFMQFILQDNIAIFYNFNKFLEYAQESSQSPYQNSISFTIFPSDQMILYILQSKYRQLRYKDFIKSLRNRNQKCTQWILNKIITTYLLFELHPIVEINGEIWCRKKLMDEKIPIIKQSEIDERKEYEILAQYSDAAVFLHRQFEDFFNHFRPISKQINLLKQKISNVWAQQKRYMEQSTTCPKTINAREIQPEIMQRVNSKLFSTPSPKNFNGKYNKKSIKPIRTQQNTQSHQQRRYSRYSSDSDIEQDCDALIKFPSKSSYKR